MVAREVVFRSHWVKTHWFFNEVCRVEPALKVGCWVIEGMVRVGSLERDERRM